MSGTVRTFSIDVLDMIEQGRRSRLVFTDPSQRMVVANLVASVIAYAYYAANGAGAARRAARAASRDTPSRHAHRSGAAGWSGSSASRA